MFYHALQFAKSFNLSYVHLMPLSRLWGQLALGVTALCLIAGYPWENHRIWLSPISLLVERGSQYLPARMVVRSKGGNACQVSGAVLAWTKPQQTLAFVVNVPKIPVS